ncbi:DUF4258 domain-containing protein [Vibrio sp. SCSIO 43137]|uniref:DUF4258 domain-containing protein n=1 Tax=Vibrio sp. SCSIO 43137 TaxID=3021011 RepID=UPI0023079FE1|nr:DUF4258 domain-containing protein [Vibrio sp. SCSIO 43137]WCE31045.1 DUF4258 domain-containing protein [Vibrio sp. SCSIO 43137]
MSTSQPLTVAEFPLTPKTAKRIVQDLATNHTGRIKLSKHTRIRMDERDITFQQIIAVLRSNSSRFEEHPYQTECGDWKMNFEGISSGETIRVPLILRRYEDDPSVLIVTVIDV